MSPDPSRSSEERRQSSENNYMVSEVNNTENNDDDISYEGYAVLPQDFNESNAESEDIDLQDSNSDEESLESIPVTPYNFDQAVKIELIELWNSSDSRVTDIVMDSNKEEEIKNAMASFKLPSTSIPLWAQSIPEEQWKQQILHRINFSQKT